MFASDICSGSGYEVRDAWENIRKPAALTVDACMKFSIQNQLLISRLADETLSPIPPLLLPPSPCFRSRLDYLHLPRAVVISMENKLRETISNIDSALQECYSRYLRLNYPCDDTDACQPRTIEGYAQAAQNTLRQLRSDSVEKLFNSLIRLSGFREAAPLKTDCAAEFKCSAPDSAPPHGYSKVGRPGVFTKEQTMVLRILLTHDDRYSPEDKQLIATALNLTREQVNRWFCNARARKKPYQKMKGKRTASSVLSNAKLSPTFEPITQVQRRLASPSPQCQVSLSAFQDLSSSASFDSSHHTTLDKSKSTPGFGQPLNFFLTNSNAQLANDYQIQTKLPYVSVQ